MSAHRRLSFQRTRSKYACGRQQYLESKFWKLQAPLGANSSQRVNDPATGNPPSSSFGRRSRFETTPSYDTTKRPKKGAIVGIPCYRRGGFRAGTIGDSFDETETAAASSIDTSWLFKRASQFPFFLELVSYCKGSRRALCVFYRNPFGERYTGRVETNEGWKRG